MRNFIFFVIALVVIVGGALVLTHKSSKNSSNRPVSSTSTPTTTNSHSSNEQKPVSANSSSNQNAVALGAVSIKDFSFSPATVTVKKGTKVTWTNNDSTAHTVTADSGNGPDSSTLNPGDTYSFTFSSAGTFAYHCSFHSNMHGTVVVE